MLRFSAAFLPTGPTGTIMGHVTVSLDLILTRKKKGNPYHQMDTTCTLKMTASIQYKMDSEPRLCERVRD